MSERQRHINKRLRATGAATAEFFRSFAADSFQQQIYSTGGDWLLRDVLAHFVSIEHTFLNYGREILAGGEGAPEDFDIDEYNEAQIALKQHQEPDELLAAFEYAREETIALVESMKTIFSRPDERRRMGEEARQRAMAVSWAESARALRRCFEEVAAT